MTHPIDINYSDDQYFRNQDLNSVSEYNPEVAALYAAYLIRKAADEFDLSKFRMTVKVTVEQVIDDSE